MSVFINDFAGEVSEAALTGKGDWEEGKYWLRKDHCSFAIRVAGPI